MKEGRRGKETGNTERKREMERGITRGRRTVGKMETELQADRRSVKERWR